MQFLKISLTGQANAGISGLSFSSKAYYQARDILCRPRVIVESQLMEIYTHPPVRHDDFSSIVRFSNVVNNTVNVLTRLGFRLDVESEGGLSSPTKQISPQLKKQGLQHLQGHQILAANLIVFKDWLESTAFIHEDWLVLRTDF